MSGVHWMGFGPDGSIARAFHRNRPKLVPSLLANRASRAQPGTCRGVLRHCSGNPQQLSGCLSLTWHLLRAPTHHANSANGTLSGLHQHHGHLRAAPISTYKSRAFSPSNAKMRLAWYAGVSSSCRWRAIELRSHSSSLQLRLSDDQRADPRQVSTALAATVVVSAFHQRANFYSAMVYLAQSNFCLLVRLPVQSRRSSADVSRSWSTSSTLFTAP